ncbi:hypothetical protein SAMD00020551_2634 [Mesobacillus selenatarsenatis SF-1]|uniref:Uncharacterized protein n=1 Tax=Mesobacillus selenatarsenatis (strain DSM 18680 / JCM 14380 / FERM P-15431 / SF-1) TaxID=1321606 RepID=A0A0A8X3J3_MESS1|nr:hypothetical protein SAMD00020551_2634 [Mesobacillus selenatarsenatis SF-1]
MASTGEKLSKERAKARGISSLLLFLSLFLIYFQSTVHVLSTKVYNSRKMNLLIQHNRLYIS